MKYTQKLGIKGIFLHLTKDIYKKTLQLANILLNDESLVFSLLLRGTKKKKVCSYHFCPAIYQRFKPVHWGKASLVAQMVKCLPAVWETWVQSLGWEDPLEKEMATHSSTLAWKIPWIEEPGRLQSMGSQRVRHD